jgi:hypothetical protein
MGSVFIRLKAFVHRLGKVFMEDLAETRKAGSLTLTAAQPAEQTKKRRDHESFARRLPIFQALAKMPALLHWTDRDVPFAWEDSEVIDFIMAHGVGLGEAKRIFEWAKQVPRSYGKNLIRFNPATRRWQGTGVVLRPRTE